MTAEGMISTFRNDGRGGSFSGLFLIFFFCLYVSCFFGGYKGGFAPLLPFTV